jgi:4-hydroxybenzoate polyprenyltransferase
MSLGVLASSIWHYGARADVYAKKHWDLVIVKNPKTLMGIGCVIFCTSIVLAGAFLPRACLVITVINAVTILCYAGFLDRYWPWKNLSIAMICVSPLLLGWFSGHRLNPIVPPLIMATFFFYLSREIFKDIVDIEANRGKRFTMVMAMGTSTALRIGGIILAVSVLFILYSLRYATLSTPAVITLILGAVWLTWFSAKAISKTNIAKNFAWMDIGVVSVLISLLITRAQMY